uniref:Basement membrane-specific heparan sulfate proteoglycan core protein n=1 Tax=Anopheles darlingi TaxID=43151 RepID=A0A2M4CZR0_ANODA
MNYASKRQGQRQPMLADSSSTNRHSSEPTGGFLWCCPTIEATPDDSTLLSASVILLVANTIAMIVTCRTFDPVLDLDDIITDGHMPTPTPAGRVVTPPTARQIRRRRLRQQSSAICFDGKFVEPPLDKRADKKHECTPDTERQTGTARAPDKHAEAKQHENERTCEQDSPQSAASTTPHATADTKPLRSDETKPTPTANRYREEIPLPVHEPDNNTSQPNHDAHLSDQDNDNKKQKTKQNNDNEPERQKDDSNKQSQGPANHTQEGAAQGWLMRSHNHSKRTTHNQETTPNGNGAKPESNRNNHDQGMRKMKKTKKPNHDKKNKQKKKQKQKKTEQEASAGLTEPSTATVTSKERQSHATGTGKGRLAPAAQSLTPPATKFAGKSGRFVGVRPKRQYDYGPIDNEGSGDAGEGSGEPPLWVNYKLQLTIPEPYQAGFRKVDQSDERILRYQADLSRLVNDVALLDVEATITRLEPYSLNKQLTLVTATFDAPQNIDLDELEESIIKQLQGPGYSLRSDGVALTPANDDEPVETTTTSFPDENDDDDEDALETTAAAPQENKCRGDDQYRCGQTEVYICDVQKCDGSVDCPNGEDESAEECPSDCRPNEIFCDRKCLAPEKRCDRIPDCSNGIDEEDCQPEARDASTAGLGHECGALYGVKAKRIPSSGNKQPDAHSRHNAQRAPPEPLKKPNNGEPRPKRNANAQNQTLTIENAAQKNSGRYVSTPKNPTRQPKATTGDGAINDDTQPQPKRINPPGTPLASTVGESKI